MRVFQYAGVLSGCLVALAGVALADQQAYVSQEEAQRGVELLSGVNEIMHFCAPCGDEEPTPEIVEALDVSATGYENYYEVKVNGEGIDLAYVYFLLEGAWTNVAMHLGLEVMDVPLTLGGDVPPPPPLPADAQPTPRDFGPVYFAGSLSEKLSIYAELAQIGGVLEGNYHYAHVGEPIMLSGEIDGGDNINLAEMADGEKTGRFVGKYDRPAGTITGQWMTPDGSKAMPFELTRCAFQVRESRLIQLSPPISGDGHEDGWYPEVGEGDAEPLPQMHVSGALPYFVPEENEVTLAINREVRQLFDGFAADSINEFARGAAEFAANPGEEWPHWLQYGCDAGIGRFYCYTDRLVSFTLGSYLYTGGAHGMYWTTPVNLGLVEGDAVPLEFDKLFTDTAAAVAIVSAHCMEDLKRQEASSVVDGTVTAFTAEDLDSFALSRQGLTIFFAPYAVASYAEGAFEVTVPWAPLAGLANQSILGDVLPE
jgi:hypothetical protein